MWYPDDRLKKKLNLCMLLQANKNIFARIKKEYKIYISNEQLHISARTTEIKLLKF